MTLPPWLDFDRTWPFQMFSRFESFDDIGGFHISATTLIGENRK